MHTAFPALCGFYNGSINKRVTLLVLTLPSSLIDWSFSLLLTKKHDTKKIIDRLYNDL